MQLNLKAFAQQRKPQTKQKDNPQIRENIFKQNNQQRINLQNIKMAHAIQSKNEGKIYQKKKMDTSPKKTSRWPTNTQKDF